MNYKNLSPEKRFAVKILATYIFASLAFGLYSEIHYRRTFRKIANVLGKDYLREPGVFEKDLKKHEELHKNFEILKFTPPIGWIFITRIENMENRLAYLGNNLALPQSKRFTSASECGKFGINPQENSDDEIVSEMLSVWN